MTARVDGQNCVYEFWMGHRPLYVGVTSNFSRRRKEHRHYIIGGATRIRLSFFSTRRRAEDYEVQRIDELRPANNIRGNPDYSPRAEETEWDAYFRDCRQEELDLAFCATELGPTPSYSVRERRMAACDLLRAQRPVRMTADPSP